MTRCVARRPDGFPCGQPAFHTDPVLGGPFCFHHYEELRNPANFQHWPRIVIRGRQERLERD